MPPPPDTFVKLCASAKIALPAAKDRAKFLVDAGTPPPSGTSSRDISERTAALVWSLASLARKEDPSSWTTSLPAALHPTLLALYPLPPWRGPGAAPPDFVRLATILELYAPDGAPQAAGAPQGAGAPSNAQPPPSGSDGININRPPDGDGGSSSSSGSGASPAPPPAPTPPAPTPPPSLKRLLHDDLIVLLHPDVYHALDSTSGMSPEKRAKFQDSCRRSSLAAVLDWTTSPPFGHQAILALSKGAHFDPIKRGLAFALAGRSAAVPSAASSFTDAMTCDAHLRTMCAQWVEMLPAFQSPAELSSTHINTLWAGATFIMTIRASRAASWGVPEVEQSCRAQLEALPTYRAAIASVLARVASAHRPAEAPRFINKSYLQFFLPFWWEHILERGALEPDKLEKTADSMLAPAVPSTPAPAPIPAAVTGPPPAQPHPWPLPPHLALPPAPGFPAFLGWPPGGPHPGVPPVAPTPPPAPLLPPGTTPPGPRPAAFVGKPISVLICGRNFGFAVQSQSRPCSCAIFRAFPGSVHYPFECPLKYHAQRGSCPGWTNTGQRIPASWSGDDITPACQAEWRAFAGPLPTARTAGNRDAAF